MPFYYVRNIISGKGSVASVSRAGGWGGVPLRTFLGSKEYLDWFNNTGKTLSCSIQYNNLLKYNHPNVRIHTFQKRWSYTLRCFFPVIILKIDLNATKIRNAPDYACTKN